ncbi:Transcriptional regulator, XRE family (plasmid) [Euzebya pacifica]|uniref:Transcriptional regulator, XRE family n=1 Tax=Euzebya pacifica TaxID=1608957 RepID=A0A346Y6J4_9ACTN|nr:helix-turn-helix transcriptional regulator [Euzebya pacifica]AXV10091.1 Transcriptional regulator, XRE family [Euzebya pacifica]
MNALGEYIRTRREQLHDDDPAFSLRRTAQRIGVGAAYLSQVETGKQIPTNDRITALAEDLDLDPDTTLAMAGRVADDIVAVIAARPALFTDLIRQLRDLPDHAVARVVREVADGDW